MRGYVRHEGGVADACGRRLRLVVWAAFLCGCVKIRVCRGYIHAALSYISVSVLFA